MQYYTISQTLITCRAMHLKILHCSMPLIKRSTIFFFFYSLPFLSPPPPTLALSNSLSIYLFFSSESYPPTAFSLFHSHLSLFISSFSLSLSLDLYLILSLLLSLSVRLSLSLSLFTPLLLNLKSPLHNFSYPRHMLRDLESEQLH